MKKLQFFAFLTIALMASVGLTSAAVLVLSGAAVSQPSVHGGNLAFVGAHA